MVSLPITVEVLADPVIDVLLPTQTICEDTDPIDLQANVSGGTGTYTYQWYESPSDTGIIGATGSTFTPPTGDEGTFNYYVVVTTESSGCETVSSVSEVIVNAGASVSVEPLSEQTVCLDGATTVLEVEYTNGVGVPTYQWYSNTICNTSDLTTATAIEGENTSTFTPPSDAVGSINYFVVLTFADGGCDAITSSCALVNVVPDPEIVISSSFPTPICEGGTIEDIEITTNGGTVCSHKSI